jgi:hypothetical protein
MADLNGINTENMSAAIRAKIYSGILRTQLEPELQAMNYVDMITDFPDGEKWEDIEIGNGTVHDYKEGDAITYDGIDIGTREFEINNYKYSGHYVTDKFVQDSYLSGQITSKIPAIQARALMADIEAKIWALQSKVQKEGFEANTVDGYHLRFAAGRVDGANDAAGTITPEDVSYGITALDDLGYTGPKVMIVPTFQQHLIPKKCLSASLSHNKAWEGIVREGAMSGTKFAFSIMGVDVYTSSFLPTFSETLKDHEGKETRVLTEAYPALLFANMPERRPFRMAWRKMPKFEGKWNMDFQREEFVTVCRYGLGVGDSKNLVVIGCSGPKTNIA